MSNTNPFELDDDGAVMISGFLKPSGEWVELPYMGHRDWAHDECESLGIESGLSEVDALRVRGYVQISSGLPFLIQDDLRYMKLTHRQLDFLLIYIDRLERETKQILTNYYEVVFPDVKPTPPPTQLIVPERYQ